MDQEIFKNKSDKLIQKVENKYHDNSQNINSNTIIQEVSLSKVQTPLKISNKKDSNSNEEHQKFEQYNESFQNLNINNNDISVNDIEGGLRGGGHQLRKKLFIELPQETKNLRQRNIDSESEDKIQSPPRQKKHKQSYNNTNPITTPNTRAQYTSIVSNKSRSYSNNQSPIKGQFQIQSQHLITNKERGTTGGETQKSLRNAKQNEFEKQLQNSRVLQIIVMVRIMRFAKTLLESSQLIMYKRINNHIVELINDKSNSEAFIKIKQKQIGILRMFKFKPFSPNSNILTTWRITYLWILRVKEVPQLLDDIEQKFQLLIKFPIAYQLIKLLLVITSLGHLFSCLFFWIATHQIDDGSSQTWLNQLENFNGLNKNNIFNIYIESYYFSIITMTTIGYGDISPTSIKEKLIVGVLAILSAGVFGYALNTIGSIFRENELKKASVKHKIFQITQYMNQRNISYQTQINVIKAIEYLNDQEQNGLSLGLQVLKQLPDYIQYDIYQEYYCKILKNSKLIKNGIYSQQLVEKLALKMNELECSQGTVLYKQGQKSDRLYFLIEGQLNIIQEYKLKDQKQTTNLIDQSQVKKNANSQNYRIIKILKGANELENNCFYSQKEHKFTIVTAQVSRLVYFDRDDILNLLKENPSDYERFCSIQDSIKYDKTKLQNKCYICNSILHQSDQCPTTHLIIGKYQLLSRHTISIDQQRQQQIYNQQCNQYQDVNIIRLRKHSFKTYKDQDLYRSRLYKCRYDFLAQNGVQFNKKCSELITTYEDIDFFYEMPCIKFIYKQQSTLLQTQPNYYIEDNQDEDFQHFEEAESSYESFENDITEYYDDDPYNQDDNNDNDNIDSNYDVYQNTANVYQEDRFEEGQSDMYENGTTSQSGNTYNNNTTNTLSQYPVFTANLTNNNILQDLSEKSLSKQISLKSSQQSQVYTFNQHQQNLNNTFNSQQHQNITHTQSVYQKNSDDTTPQNYNKAQSNFRKTLSINSNNNNNNNNSILGNQQKYYNNNNDEKRQQKQSFNNQDDNNSMQQSNLSNQDIILQKLGTYKMNNPSQKQKRVSLSLGSNIQNQKQQQQTQQQYDSSYDSQNTNKMKKRKSQKSELQKSELRKSSIFQTKKTIKSQQSMRRKSTIKVQSQKNIQDNQNQNLSNFIDLLQKIKYSTKHQKSTKTLNTMKTYKTDNNAVLQPTKKFDVQTYSTYTKTQQNKYGEVSFIQINLDKIKFYYQYQPRYNASHVLFKLGNIINLKMQDFLNHKISKHNTMSPKKPRRTVFGNSQNQNKLRKMSGQRQSIIQLQN